MKTIEQLETELAAVQAECLEQARLLGISGSREASLIARLEKAETDTARLDWLDENMDYSGGGSGGMYSFFTPADVECGMLRYAIDAAMKSDSK